MTDQTLKYPRGSIMVMTSGMYSDFRVRGFLVAVRDCDLPALAKDFAKAEWKRLRDAGQADWDTPAIENFPSWLVANGHAMPVDASEIHLGDGTTKFEPEFGVPDMWEESDHR